LRSRAIDRLSADLRRDFPDMTGLSARNLKYMRALAETHSDPAFVPQVVARLPWGHVVRFLESVKDVTRREWYARQAIEHGWSRNVLVYQIESSLLSVRVRRSRTSHGPFQPCSPNLPNNSSRPLTASTLLATMNKAAHGLEVEAGAATEALRVASSSWLNSVALRRNRTLIASL
jgi:hypothetical protein